MTCCTTTLHGLLRTSVERGPERALFIDADVETTYEQLWMASGRLARALAELGLARGQRVALALDAGADFLICYYGVIRAGGVVVPLPAETRSEPLVYALRHSRSKLLIIESNLLRYLAGRESDLPELTAIIRRGPALTLDLGGVPELSLDELAGVNGDPQGVPDSGAPDDMLSIIYTSGTTGTPKGVMLTHKNLVANVRSIIQYLGLTRHDRVAMVLPFHYAYGNSVLHTHVGVGASIVRAGTMAFPARVLQIMAERRCTGFSGVPATFARLASFSGIERYDLTSLRYVTQAGAAMTPALTERLSATFPQAQLFVMYGQTEASARLSYVPPAELERKLGSAGKAIPGVKLEIVDRCGRALPPHTRGEVVATGDNIMLGYWNEPEQTARVLRRGRLHTGDLGWLDEEGYLYLVGREGEMIKSGAHRISPREIETVLERIDGVRECAVLGVPDEMLGQAIAAAVVPHEGRLLDRQALLAACLEALPRFKLPVHVLQVAELPRGATGKVLRAALLPLFTAPTRREAGDSGGAGRATAQ